MAAALQKEILFYDWITYAMVSKPDRIALYRRYYMHWWSFMSSPIHRYIGSGDDPTRVQL